MRKLSSLFLLLLLAHPAAGAELAGVTLPDRASVGDETLVLNGLGLRKKAIFKVYVAGLYLTARSSDGAAILGQDASRRLVMEFVRKVGKDSITGGWDDCLANNSPSAAAEVQRGFAQLNGWMEDVTSGDQLIFTYTPSAGTQVQVKGQSKGTVPGRAFGDALFSCWIGEVPPSAEFKDGLLGG